MNKFKVFLNKFFLIDDTPHKIAAGVALGIFLGIIPGEGFFSTLFFAYILRFNRLAAMAGVLFFNMWTTLAVFPLAVSVGGFIFSQNKEKLVTDFNSTYHLGYKYFLSKVIFFDLAVPLIVGFFVVAGFIAFSFYFLIYFLLKYKKIQKIS